MIRQRWEKALAKIEAMSLRERVLIFAAAAAFVVALLNMLLLQPALQQQKRLREQLLQQQQKMNEVQAQIAGILQQNSPLRGQISTIRQELKEGSAYLNGNRERLVEPEKMALHLRKILNKNSNLQLISLRTLPVTPLAVSANAALSSAGPAAVAVDTTATQVFKHGVQLTLRGNYLDLLQYLQALERLPQQMYWAGARLQVVKYPDADLTLILYTLSLDKTWLRI